MNKRLGLLSLFGITALLLAMVGAITAMAAPSAANVNGTVTLNKAWYTTAADGKTVIITVADADQNVSTAAVADKTVVMKGALQTQLINVTVGTDVRVVGTPTILTTSGKLVADCISANVDTNLSIAIFADGSTGNLIVTNAAAVATDTPRTVCYSTNKLDTVSITAKSGLDTTGIIETATETGVDTGIFKVTITLTDGASSTTAKTLKSGNNDAIYAEYTDLAPASGVSLKITSVSSKVETQKPTFSALLPVDKFSTSAASVTYAGTVSDGGGSGVDIGTISVVLDTGANVPTTITGISGDASVTFAVTLASGTEASHLWYVTAKDVAGNLGYSDSDPATAGDASTSDAQKNTLKVDKTGPIIKTSGSATVATPGFVTITSTGRYYDLSLTSPGEGKNRTTSLVVVFSEDLDPSTVAADGSDFSVTGNTVTAAAIYQYFATGTTTPILGRNRVYLTLGTALARDATPTVSLATGQSVADLAGNTLSAGSADATFISKDGIAPSFTFTAANLDKTVTRDTLVATFTSTENIDGLPTAKAYGDFTDPVGQGGVSGTTSTTAGVAMTVELTGTNAWKATYTVVAGKDGKYSIQVKGSDGVGNSGTGGKTTTADPAAIIFTQDTTVPAPSFTASGKDFTPSATSGNVGYTGAAIGVGVYDAVTNPGTATAGAVDVQGTAPLITVTFGNVHLAGAALFTYPEQVTVQKAYFGVSGSEVDVRAKGSLSTDGKSWLYQASGLTLGKTYKIIVSATDLAGNVITDVGASFNTIAVKLPETIVKPGQNLISFTGNPVSGAINTVFSDLSVTAVVTYDPLNPDPTTGSPWLTANRGADGKLSGSLKKVDGQHSYFVKASGFVTLKVEIAKLGFDAVPSVIAVKKGWNLLPVVSVEGATPLASGNTCATALAAGELAHCVAADTYLGTIKWTTAYTYDPITAVWTKIVPKTFANLEIGRGYWVYVSEDGTLVP